MPSERIEGFTGSESQTSRRCELGDAVHHDAEGAVVPLDPVQSRSPRRSSGARASASAEDPVVVLPGDPREVHEALEVQLAAEPGHVARLVQADEPLAVAEEAAREHGHRRRVLAAQLRGAGAPTSSISWWFRGSRIGMKQDFRK